MAEIQIYDMATNATPNDDDFFEQDIVDLDLPAGRNNKKISLGATADFIAKTHNYTSDLQTTNKTIVGAINEVLNEGTSVSVTNVLPATETTKRVATITVDGVAKDVNADDADKILRAAFGEHTVSGNPVSVDAFLGLEVPSSCKVTMNPIQDLHGYDHPWAGGAGKNLIPYPYTTSSGTIANVVCTVGTNGSIKCNGTANASGNFYLIQQNYSISSGTYTLSVNGKHSGATIRLRDRDASSNLITIESGTTSESGTVTIPSDLSNCMVYINWANSAVVDVDCTIQLEIGSTTTDYAPYSNICPILGRDSVVLRNGGKNRVIYEIENSYINANGVILYSSDYDMLIAPVTQGIKYTVTTNGSQPRFGYYTNAPKLNSVSYNSTRASADNTVFTVTAPINGYIAVRCNHGFTAWQIEEGETATERQAPTTHTHQYGQTVYGGEDDFVNGGLTNEWGYIASYNGETLPGEWVSDRDVYQAGTTPTTGAEVVYRLSTPTIIQTSAEDISLLKGTNVVSTDGDDMEMKYSADIKAYIDSKLA